MTAFWILAPLMVLAALGLVFAKKAVHGALCLAVVMISLAEPSQKSCPRVFSW